jgi:hypothetical protein
MSRKGNLDRTVVVCPACLELILPASDPPYINDGLSVRIAELLRIYWYDAAPRKELTPEQQEVWQQTDTKLRLGSLTKSIWLQKGVDARLLTTSCRELSVSPEDQLDYDARMAPKNGFWDEFEPLEAVIA